MQRLQYAAAPAEGDIISGQHENNPSFTAPEIYFIFSLLITDFSALNIFKYIISPAGNATSVRFKLWWAGVYHTLCSDTGLYGCFHG